MARPEKREGYTDADFLAWNGGDRFELMDGEPVRMAPPSRIYQAISMEFSRQFSNCCGQSKLDGRGCKGAPALTLEILSPSNAQYDTLVKLNLYQKAGCREYWAVSPDDKTVRVFVMGGGALKLHEAYNASDIVKVNVLDGCFIELSKVFSQL